MFIPTARRTWTVRDLVAAVRTSVEREYGDIWVEGEISNFKAHESGHLYFTLKDASAQMRVVMFRSSAKLLRFRPENGMVVVARGRVTVYEDRGELQISAEYLEPKGAGALQIAFEQLKAKLEAEGLFDARPPKADSHAATEHRDRDFAAGGGAARHSQYSAAAASRGERPYLSGAGAGRSGGARSHGWGAALQ